VKVPGAKGYIYRSTRTSNEHEAFKFADDLYNRTLVKVLSGGNPHAKKIGKAIEGYVARFDSQRSRLSVQYKILLLERCKPFLASKTFDELDTALLSGLMGSLSENSSKGHLSANTIKRIHSDLKHFLHWCVEEGYLDKVPVFPRTSSDNARRPHFDGADWRKLTRHLREFVKVKNKATLRARTMLVNYVLILANTGIRIGEARLLKWRDIRRVNSGTSPSIVLTVKGKTGISSHVPRGFGWTRQVPTFYRSNTVAIRSNSRRACSPSSVQP
jgi:integrase